MEKVIVMRNCDTSGNLLDLKLSKSRFIIADPWAMLRIKTFRDCGQDIQVPICKTCNNHMDNLAADQSIENLKSMLCNHAKIASNIIRNFDNPVNLTDDDSNDLKVEIIHKKEDRSSKSQHLAVVFQKKKTSLLFTTGKQVTPTCTVCSSFKCQCIRALDYHIISV